MKYFPAVDIPDLSGKIVLVTGGTSGLGEESIYQLARHNPAKIYLAARSESKAYAAIEAIETSVGPTCAPIEFIPCELSSLVSVQTTARTFLAKGHNRLDVLICNAGVLGGETECTTEGYEAMFGVNYMAHALLVSLLLPTLQATAGLPDVMKGDTRVIFVGSSTESWTPNWAKNQYPYAALKNGFPGANVMIKYAVSKLAMIHAALALSEKYPEESSGLRFVSLHPGTVSTNLGRDLFLGWAIKKMTAWFSNVVSVEEGAKNQLWAATWPTSKAGGPRSGVYYTPVGISGGGSKRTKDKDMAKDLWEWTENELAGCSMPEMVQRNPVNYPLLMLGTANTA